jgi:hypothetical protein
MRCIAVSADGGWLRTFYIAGWRMVWFDPRAYLRFQLRGDSDQRAGS